ncbi:zf-HC2 domain-containing protein [Robertmurraya sp. DFI.2.37]|uniref:zf-HC2 domain-containing protein n=1 Tax=Robertmurraya sp. DFI.2.37 TaxID=3031819 RepID=UPI0012440935|nr:zf-HC2 domain-containing protein [Robertmurraya sp. DFI.2.37]MDF1509111.1 zf-HC2 domain-containing protein [Robertmurraya sp. DFI.2.37]
MKCNLVRDLLPLYIEGDCSSRTNRMVKEHLLNCSKCRELYEIMEPPIDLKFVLPQESMKDLEIRQKKLWRKYYGRLILKGSLLFIVVYSAVLSFIELIK